MKSFVKISLSALVVFIFSYQSMAQSTGVSKAEVKRYLQTSRLILEERNALDIQIQNLKEPKEGEIEQLKQKIKDAPQNHGWDADYEEKVEIISVIFNAIAAMRDAEAVQDDTRDQRIANAQKSIDKLIAKYGEKSMTAVEKSYVEIDQIIKGLI